MTEIESLAQQANEVAAAVKSLERAVKELVTVLKEVSGRLVGPNVQPPTQ